MTGSDSIESTPGPIGVSCAVCQWEGDQGELVRNAFGLLSCPRCYSSQIREGGPERGRERPCASARSPGPALP